jgi:hypothetical protein
MVAIQGDGEGNEKAAMIRKFDTLLKLPVSYS